MSFSLPVAGLVLVLGTVGVGIGSGWLEEASETLSRYYGLPVVVQGAIVTAIGSSMPELASVVFAALVQQSLELGVGAIVGSAVFNILVIPALAGITTDEPLEANRALVYKEAQFYMLAVSVLVITFAMAVIYYPAEGPVLAGHISRPLAVIPLGLYGLYVFIQSQDTADHEADYQTDDIELLREWGRLLAGLAVVLVAVHFLVEAVSVFGAAAGVPSFVMGATVLAGATSLPDGLVSIRAARNGRGVAALANVLGSNTFDLLVAIPVGVLIVGKARADVNFEIAVPMFAVLTGATILLFTFLRTDMELTDLEAYALLVAYLVFVVWVVAEVFGFIVGIPAI